MTPRPSSTPSPKPQQRADQAEQDRLAEDEREELPAGRAEHTQDGKQRPALDDAEGNSVVDEEHADDESQHAQRRQVELERGRHLLDGVLARRGRLDGDAGRQHGADRGQRRFVGGDKVDVAELAAQIEHLLGRGEVGEEDAVQGAAGYVVGRTQQPTTRAGTRRPFTSMDSVSPRATPAAAAASADRMTLLGSVRKVVSASGLRLPLPVVAK
jgi:hypothetical protein